MDVPEQKPETQETKKTSFLKPPKYIVMLLGLMVVVIIAASGVAWYNYNQDTTNEPATNQTNARLYLSPAALEVAKGQTVSLSVWADAGSSSVNAVQATLSYPVDKFEFVSVDSTVSAFEIEAEASHNDGKIVMARGHIGTLTGPQIVGKVTLKALVDTDSATVSFIDTSVLLSSDTNQDVLSQKVGGIYSFKVAQ